MSGNTVGSLLGAGIGFLIGGPAGAKWGFVIGGAIGGYVDPVKIKGPRLSDASRQTSMEGVPIPWGYGTFPTAGNIIFSGPLDEHEHEEGGKGGPVTVSYTYTRSYAIGICEGPISGIQKIKRNGKLVYDISPGSTLTAENAKFLEKCTIYLGDETQTVDPTIEAVVGVGETGPYRGLAYIVLEDDDLTESQGAIAQYEFVVQMCGTVTSVDSGLMSLGPEFYYPFTADNTDETGNHVDLTLYGSSSISGGGLTLADGTGNAHATTGSGMDAANLSIFVRFRLNVAPGGPRWIFSHLTNDTFGFYNWAFFLISDGQGGYLQLGAGIDHQAGAGDQVYAPGLLTVGVDYVAGIRKTGTLLELLLNGAVVASTSCDAGAIGDGTAAFMVGDHHSSSSPQMTLAHGVGVRRAVSGTEAALASYTMGVLPEGYYPVPDVPGALVDADGNLLTGTVGSESISSCDALLADIVDDLCFRSSLDVAEEVDTSELTDIVKGFKCATQSGADQYIEALTMSHFFDRAEWDKKLRFPKRGGAVVAALTMDDLVRRDGPAIRQTRIQEPELLRKVNILSIDPAADYNVTKQTWERRAGTIKAIGESSVEIPEVVETDTAAQIAEIRGKIAWAETDKFDFGFSVKWSKLTPTDPITLTDRAGLVHRIRLQSETEERGVFFVEEGVKDRASVYVSTATGVTNPNGPGTTTPGVVGPTLFMAMNLPQMRTQDGPGLWVGLAGITPGWAGAQLLMSVDGGTSYTPVLTVTTPTKLGYLTADLDAVGSASEPLSVHIYGGTLSSATAAQVAQGINYSAVQTEQGTSGKRAEVIAYEDATETTASYYNLSTLTRGIKGTEVEDHFTGDEFMDLATAHLLQISQAYAGMTLYFKAVGFGTSADSVTAVPVEYEATQIVHDGGVVTP